MDKTVGSIDLEELKRAREELNRERGIETDPNMYKNYNPNRNNEEQESSNNAENMVNENSSSFDSTQSLESSENLTNIEENSTNTEESITSFEENDTSSVQSYENENSNEVSEDFSNESENYAQSSEEKSEESENFESESENSNQSETFAESKPEINEEPIEIEIVEEKESENSAPSSVETPSETSQNTTVQEKDFSVYDNFSEFEIEGSYVPKPKVQQESVSNSEKVQNSLSDNEITQNSDSSEPADNAESIESEGSDESESTVENESSVGSESTVEDESSDDSDSDEFENFSDSNKSDENSSDVPQGEVSEVEETDTDAEAQEENLEDTQNFSIDESQLESAEATNYQIEDDGAKTIAENALTQEAFADSSENSGESSQEINTTIDEIIGEIEKVEQVRRRNNLPDPPEVTVFDNKSNTKIYESVSGNVIYNSELERQKNEQTNAQANAQTNAQTSQAASKPSEDVAKSTSNSNVATATSDNANSNGSGSAENVNGANASSPNTNITNINVEYKNYGGSQVGSNREQSAVQFDSQKNNYSATGSFMQTQTQNTNTFDDIKTTQSSEQRPAQNFSTMQSRPKFSNLAARMQSYRNTQTSQTQTSQTQPSQTQTSQTQTIYQNVGQPNSTSNFSANSSTQTINVFEQQRVFPKIPSYKFVDLISTDEFKRSQKMSYIFGKDEKNRTLYMNIKDMFNTVIFGSDNYYNFAQLSSIMLSLALKNTIDEINFVILDSSLNSEFDIFNSSEYMFFNRVAKTNNEIYETLTEMVSELNDRYDLLVDAGVRNIEQYNSLKINPKDRLSNILIVFSNYTASKGQMFEKEIDELILTLLKLGRIVGINLIISAYQTMDNSEINFNLAGRIAYKTANAALSEQQVGSNSLLKIMGEGEFLYASMDSDLELHLKAPDLSVEDAVSILRRLK